MPTDLKTGLIRRLKKAGAYDARVADPHVGYEHVLPGMHPLEVWPACRSVVVIAVACAPEANNTYIGTYAPWSGERDLGPVPEELRSDDYGMDRLSRLVLASLTLKGIEFLHGSGCGVQTVPQARMQLKLSAYEAGIGVYGRAGFILHPVLGSHLQLAAILTDAVLEPDGRLEGFDPCAGCDRCIRLCPAQAYDASKSYPDSWSREACTAKRAELARRGLFCHTCNAACPAGSLHDVDLLRIGEARSIYSKGVKR